MVSRRSIVRVSNKNKNSCEKNPIHDFDLLYLFFFVSFVSRYIHPVIDHVRFSVYGGFPISGDSRGTGYGLKIIFWKGRSTWKSVDCANRKNHREDLVNTSRKLHPQVEFNEKKIFSRRAHMKFQRRAARFCSHSPGFIFFIFFGCCVTMP